MSHPLLSRFGALTKTGEGWTGLCPAHPDKARSLSLRVSNGKLLLNCFAGCTYESILAAKGLMPADVHVNDAPAHAAKMPQLPVTVGNLAHAKGLPLAALTRYKVIDVDDLNPADKLKHGLGGRDGIWIPYFHADGTIAARTRHRSALIAKQGSSWLTGQGSGPVLPYGLHDLQDAREQGCVVLCEGESDYWTLRHAGIPALGLPGAQMVRSLRPDHLTGIPAVYVAQDNDTAGAQFTAGVKAHVASWGLAGVFPVLLPSSAKDVNDLYRKDPVAFHDAFVALMQKAARGEQSATRAFSTAGEIYTLTVPEHGLRLELDQIRRHGGLLYGELAVLAGEDDLWRGNVNISNGRYRQGDAAQIAKRSQRAEVDWSVLMEDFATHCLRAERTGRPGVWLDEITPRQPSACVEVSGFELPLDLPACLFGDGDTGKSYLALHLLSELTRRGIACGVVDAEMEDTIHAGRLRDLCGTRPRIAHLRLDRPLAQSVDHVRRFVRDMGLQYLAYDSVGFLTPEPEKSESALSYMRAVRQVGLGSLSIAHVTKLQDVKPEQQKPFGSNFYYQSFRRIWYAQAEAETDREGRKVIGIWDRKANTARKRPPFGLALTVRPGFASVEPADLQTSELAPTLSIPQRLTEALRSGPLSIDDLAERLDVPVKSVTSALSRGRTTGRFKQTAEAHGAPWVNGPK